MTTNWLGVLLFDKTLTDEEYEDIPYPRLELHTHVFWKHVQFGSIMGLCVVGPILGAVRGRSLAAIRTTAVKTGKMMTLGLPPLAPLFVEMTIKEQEEERVFDRSFRLRHNEGQLRADRYSLLSALAGGLLSGPSGAVVGVATGTFVAALQ